MTTQSAENKLAKQQIETQLKDAERALSVGEYKRCHQIAMAVLNVALNKPIYKPYGASALLLLGIITAEHNNHSKALDVFKRALTLDENNAAIHAQLAKSLLALSRRTEALTAISHAETIAKQDANIDIHTLDTIGVVNSRAGQHQHALGFYQKALKKVGDKASADQLYNYATALQFVGDMDNAKDVYHRVLKLEPKHVRTWSSLIYIDKQSKDSNHIEELTSLYNEPSRNVSDANNALHIGHALAKSYEDIGDSTSAMHWLAKAKAPKRKEINYDFAVEQAMFDAALTSAKTIAQSASQALATEPTEQSPIFVVGMPRTGTTLIDRIISSHSDVTSVGELSDFALALKRETRTSSAYVIDEQTLLAGANANLMAVGKAYRENVANSFPGLKRCLDKMPLNFLSAALIAQAMPDSRIICVRRNPADTILSNYRQLFATSFSYYNYAFDLEDCARYTVAFNQLVESFKALLPDTVFIDVLYEDVITDLETQARRLINFCNLEWQEQCLDFQNNQAPVATASSAQVRAPLYSSSIGRWRFCQEEMQAALDILDEHQIPYE